MEATKFGKKICVIGGSHLNRIKRNIFQRSVNGGGEAYFNVFRGPSSKRFNHYILPTLHEHQPDISLLHIGPNDINNQAKDRINTEKITGDIINIGKSSINIGGKEVVISSVLPKKALHEHVLNGR